MQVFRGWKSKSYEKRWAEKKKKKYNNITKTPTGTRRKQVANKSLHFDDRTRQNHYFDPLNNTNVKTARL